MGLITIPYFCRKYDFHEADVLRNIVKFLRIQPVTGNLETRGMRFYREKDLLFVYDQLIKMAEIKKTDFGEV
ncbi:hypothetical protein [Marinitoga sp. 1155]|uniref:hypothetical protein n=1 Tax=Marinitoga sp. 1155 TaxID=1428448 RepID=UPI00064125AA|nr:hypothetical protein [Marinitoga sp. 1155]KLO22769.1 hypothetical protein X274_07710 [Marinitoga sp. 1155]